MRIELGKEASVSSEKTNHTKFTPSNTEKEAKRRFMSTLENGVGKLLAQGNGRDRISTQLLNEISNGCSPDETEVCQYCMFCVLGWCFCGMILYIYPAPILSD